jgi:hypothetical protein
VPPTLLARAGISGAKGRDRRPAFDRLCRDATRRFDIIISAQATMPCLNSFTRGA